MTDDGATGARPGDRAALDRLLGVPEMAWLVDRVRARILAAGDAPLRGVVQLDRPTDAQRAAAVRLVGRPRRGGATLRVDLAVVEQILRRGPWPAGLADAVETLTGPVVDREALRAREAAGWAAARDALEPAARRFDGLLEWWHAWCAAGGLKRTASAEAARTGATSTPEIGARLVRDLLAVLDRLPAQGRPLAVLAREAVGDAHALDVSRPFGRLAATVVREAFRPGTSSEGPVRGPAGRDSSARDAWAAAGVVISNVASTVVCLGIPGERGHDGAAARATATALEAMRVARMPVVLTLDQVRSGGVAVLPPGGIVHVCENPSVVEVTAARWAEWTPVDRGPDRDHQDGVVPVLVCTGGQPSTAVVEVLQRLSAAGAQVRYHGDFDWAGLRIARALDTHVSWVPWRFRAADYLAAVTEGTHSLRLTGSPAPSPWDPGLATAMAEHARAVEEEFVADLLAADVLRIPTPAAAPSAQTGRLPTSRNAPVPVDHSTPRR